MSTTQFSSDYALAAREPTLWLSHARTLHSAASLVYSGLAEAVSAALAGNDRDEERLRLMGPYMLLSGMALENLLKGILVLRDSAIVTDTGLNRKRWPGGAKGGHALELMGDSVLAPLSDEDRDLLQRLEIFVLWGGRYPVPLDALSFVAMPLPGGAPLSRRFHTADPDRIEALFRRLETSLLQEAALNPR